MAMARGIRAGRRAARSGRRGRGRQAAAQRARSSSSKRVPLGVVAVIYEGRPNVTSDAAALCIKSGNAAILRGSSVARRSNGMIADVLTRALIEADAPPGAIVNVEGDHDQLRELIQMKHLVDLVVPRGGEELKSVPDGARDGAGHLRGVGQQPRLRRRRRRRRRRPSRSRSTPRCSARACATAAETLLVHRDVAASCAPARSPCGRSRQRRRASDLRRQPRGAGRGGRRARRGHRARLRDRVPRPDDGGAGRRQRSTRPSSTSHRYGSGHSEAIVTRSLSRRTASSRPGSMRRASTSTRRRGSPTAASSAWAPRSPTPRRSSTHAARSGCAS